MPDAAALSNTFDCVVMFTWSNWKTEPRSNRYHYATRFARHLPVVFVQNTEPAEPGQLEEPVDDHGITIVHAGSDYGAAQSERLRQVLYRRNVRKPLYWVYNPCYEDFIDRFPGQLLIYHATEDYLADHREMKFVDQSLVDRFLRLLGYTDLVIAVSEPVASSVRRNSDYDGPVLLLRNGCDPGFWREAIPDKPQRDEKIVFFQGGVNARVDFALVHELVHDMPDWQFWFCGDNRAAPQPDWNILCSHSNVQAFGGLHPEKVASLQARASVGIIPFRQISTMQISLPLKAYEYVASGLPVVTIPISELGRRPDLFKSATNAAGFSHQIRLLAPTRWDENELARRFEAANEASYDRRFAEFLKELRWVVETRTKPLPQANVFYAPQPTQMPAEPSETMIAEVPVKPEPITERSSQEEQSVSRRKRVLVTYSASATHVQTTADYLLSLSRHLDAEVRYLHVTHDAIPDFDFSDYDAIFQSYCARWPFKGYVSAFYSDSLARFSGLKILAVQDEYDRTDMLKDAILRHGFDVVLTCVPTDQIEKVYPHQEFPNTEFVQVLTGYVPEDISDLERYALPLEDRKTLIGYRGRDIGGRYGRLAWDKLEIGRRVREACEARGLPVDIDWTDQSRIYGKDWFKFLGSCRATLGTESGSNVFDFDGRIETQFRELTEQRGRAPSYDEFLPLVRAKDESMDMGQVSPKVFEAIAVRTPLVLMRGRYSGVVEADKHYIPLELDYSNLDSVLARLQDLPALKAMTERAYENVVASGRFGYPAFVHLVDTILERKLEEKRKFAPVAKFDEQFVEPDIATDDRPILIESATDLPTSNDLFWLKIQKRQTNIYRREVDRLNQVYPAEIQRISTAAHQQWEAQQAEMNRLNAELSRLGRLAAASAEQAAASYQQEAAGYKAELDRVLAENVELRQLRESDVQRFSAFAESQAAAAQDSLAELAGELRAIHDTTLADLRDRVANGEDPPALTALVDDASAGMAQIDAHLHALQTSWHVPPITYDPALPLQAVTLPPPPSRLKLKLAVAQAKGTLAASRLGTRLRAGPAFNAAKRADVLQRIRRRIRTAPGLGPVAIWVYTRLNTPR